MNEPHRTLANLLKQHSMRAADLARALDIAESTVSRWLSGTTNPNDSMKAAIATELGVDISTLWPDLANSARGRRSQRQALTTAWARRTDAPADLWRQLADDARETIDILGHSISFFLEQDPAMRKILEARAAAGTPVRVILAQPDGRAVENRDRNEDLDGTLAGRVRTSVQAFQKVEGLQLRLHDVDISGAVYRFDDDALFTPFLVGKLAAEAPMLHLTKVDGVETMFDRLAVEQFADVWAASEPVPA